MSKIECPTCGEPEYKSYIRQGMCRDCHKNDFEDYVTAVAGDVPHTVEYKELAQERFGKDNNG